MPFHNLSRHHPELIAIGLLILIAWGWLDLVDLAGGAL